MTEHWLELKALIQHQAVENERLRIDLAYYKNELNEAQTLIKKLQKIFNTHGVK